MNGCSPPGLLGVRPTTSKSYPAASSSARSQSRRRALLDSLVHPDSGIASLSIALGDDACDFGLPRPENRFFSKPKG